MPTPTYTLIEEQVLGSAQASVTFSSITQTYRDLVVEVSNVTHSYAGTGGVFDFYLQFNGDTAGNYSTTLVRGTGSVAESSTSTNMTGCGADWPMASAPIGMIRGQIEAYSATNVFKSVLTRADCAGTRTMAGTSTWRNTAAITSIRVGPSGTYTMPAGTTVRLWGV